MNILSIFKKLGRVIASALRAAEDFGLTDAIVRDAQLWVSRVPGNLLTNGDKREWAVTMLVSNGVKESIARLAVEMAVQLWKRRGLDAPSDVQGQAITGP